MPWWGWVIVGIIGLVIIAILIGMGKVMADQISH